MGRALACAAAILGCSSLAACGGSGDATGAGQRLDSGRWLQHRRAVHDRGGGAFQADNSEARITVGVSGTGGGFERFCRGETDISDASRPIEGDEASTCDGNGVEYVELQVANDALTVVVNKENNWADCLTVAQLKQIWEPNSDVSNWNQVDADYPDEKLSLYGPGTDSGTFDYFTDEINGEEGASRSDYTASENDNVLVRGVEGQRERSGYFGFSYYEENKDQLKAVAVNDGSGCVEPSVTPRRTGTYKPLSPAALHLRQAARRRHENVSKFVE